MKPSDEPAASIEPVPAGRSRLQAILVVAVAATVVGVGLVAGLNGSGDDATPSAPPTTTEPAAAATTRPTPRPTPIPLPTPEPVLPSDPILGSFDAAAIPAELSPTGALVADTGEAGIGELVADADGTYWATRRGGIVNIDPRSGRTREWTLADDPAFATSFPAPSRQGGVWLVGPDAVRLFDGDRFRAVIATPAALWFLAEDQGGTLWAQAEQYGLIRWIDGTWSSDPPGRPSRDVNDVAIDGDGIVWAANFTSGGGWAWISHGISMWDGSRWTNLGSADLPGIIDPDGEPPTLIVAPDGHAWAASGRNVARLDSAEAHELADLVGDVSLVAVDGEGRSWFIDRRCESCGLRILVHDGTTVTTYDEDDGLPGRDEIGWPDATVVALPDLVLIATEAGPYRLSDGRWERLELTTSAGPSPIGSRPVHGVVDLAAVSRNEVWAVGALDLPSDDWPMTGLFRFDGTAWHRRRLPVETTIGKVQLAPDGSLWVATAAGPFVLRDGAWIDLGDAVAAAVPEPDEQMDDCGGAVSVRGDGVAFYVGPRSGGRVVELRPVDDTWQALMHSPWPAGLGCWGSLAATPDGAVWIFSQGWGSSLTRSTGGRWEDVPLTDPTAIAVGPDGSLRVATADWSGAEPSTDLMVQQPDGGWASSGAAREVGDVAALTAAPDGSLVAVGDGVAIVRDGGARRLLQGVWFSDVSVAPDGAIWVSGPNVLRLAASLP